jgi:GAF domain-containing protein
VDAAGLMLSDQRGELVPLAASSENARLLEWFQLQGDEGPCLDSFRAGAPLSCPSLAEDPGRWPRFAQRAQHLGFASVHALPLRLREQTIGALNLLNATPGPLPVADLRLGQALADVATIGILQERAIHRREILAEQLQGALNNRIIIEQAKGILAERAGIGTDEAFTRLRTYAREHHRRLGDLARTVVLGEEDIPELAHPWA